MEERLKKLITAFTDNGWTCRGSVDISSDWWFQDIIELSSVMRPVGANIYFTLLTDPQVLERKIVWAVGISLNIPTNRHFRFLEQITMNNIKKTNLNILVGKINNAILK